MINTIQDAVWVRCEMGGESLLVGCVYRTVVLAKTVFNDYQTNEYSYQLPSCSLEISVQLAYVGSCFPLKINCFLSVEAFIITLEPKMLLNKQGTAMFLARHLRWAWHVQTFTEACLPGCDHPPVSRSFILLLLKGCPHMTQGHISELTEIVHLFCFVISFGTHFLIP